MIRLVATQLPSDPAAFGLAAQAASAAVAAVAGVAKVEVIPAAAERLYAEFDELSLQALGLTPTDLARQIREPLGLDPLSVTVGPSAIGLPSEQVAVERLREVPVAFEGGEVTLASVARIRQAPDHTAPPPGLAITLAPGADREAVRELAAAALEGLEAAAPLALAVR
jgi:multidrug efflux pump subunit AcrB